MLNINKLLSKFFKNTNEKELDLLKSTIIQINSLENEISKLKKEDFPKKTQELKKKLNNNLSLNKILPEAFALVREASKRTLNERHYDVQMMGGIILHQGKIAEMKTGEGKTLVSTLPIYLNSLLEKGVHIVTVNDYLAKRDSAWMGKIYNYLGISCGCILNGMEDLERKKNYQYDVTYGTNSEFGFDYLKDNMKYSLDEVVQRGHEFCIVDEVDSILIDEARTPLVISGAVEDKSDKYFVANKIVKSLNKDHYEIDEKNKNVFLSENGIDKIEKMLNNQKILKNNNFYDPQNMGLVHHINQALRANSLFSKDTDYIVRNGKVELIDEFTGRVLEGRRYSDGLHQAIEAKENVEIQTENQTLASITYQNYFRLYKKLSGMTGTAQTEAEEFFDIYRLNTISVPTNQKMIRKDMNDQIFRTAKEKNDAIINQITSCNKNGQPVLVGTTSIEKSEQVSSLLKNKNINHKVLNAKYHEEEAKIIAQAGEKGAVTIATNMAGRGTDIQLGGNLSVMLSEKEKISEEEKKEITKLHTEQKKEVKNIGGLFIVGTERHESRRIDNQLRGRSGRQGDEGNSIFFISLEDDLMRIFGSESIDSILKKFGLKENESINHPWINKALERAQQKVEARNFDIRKSLLKFDDVTNEQRQAIFSQRQEILNSENIESITNNFLKEISSELNLEKNELKKTNKENDIKLKIKNILGKSIKEDELNNLNIKTDNEINNIIEKKFNDTKLLRTNSLGDKNNNELEKRVFLQILDFSWRSHLQYLEELRQVINLRAYGQKDPLNEYKKEAFELFENLIKKMKYDLISFLNNLTIVEKPTVEKDNQTKEVLKPSISELSQNKPNCLLIINKNKKISRNDRCLETGKKFKNCCGAI